MLALIWLPFEGNIFLVVPFGWLTGFTVLVLILSRFLHKTTFALPGWIVLWGGLGGIIGLLTPWLIVGLMILKTGVHAHGPEYTPAEIAWTLSQFPGWGVIGAGFGVGYGLLSASWQRSHALKAVE